MFSINNFATNIPHSDFFCYSGSNFAVLIFTQKQQNKKVCCLTQADKLGQVLFKVLGTEVYLRYLKTALLRTLILFLC